MFLTHAIMSPGEVNMCYWVHLWRLGSTEAFRFFWRPGDSADSGPLVVFSSDKLLWYNVGEYGHIIHSSKRSEVRPHVPNNKPAAFYRSVGK